mgnify:CR=1 FL=1
MFLVLLLMHTFLFAQDRTFSSNLPLVFIDTGGEPIHDEPKRIAEMGIVWNGKDSLNESTAPFNHYYGKIGIEIRGSSSQMFPKKSYGFETRDANGNDMDFPLLGLPEEEDWILYAPYSDKSLIRNVLVFTLAASLEHYTPRCRFVELFLNNEYQGVYVLMEKIKRDKSRVDIARLRTQDTTGVELTGGYIVKIDKKTGGGGGGWYSQYRNPMNRTTFYQYEYPDDDEIQPDQANYIQQYIHDFESAVHNEEFDKKDGYWQYINDTSFIDYLILNELSKNVDAYRLSAFFYKDKGGKLNAGPVWDFNLAFGNANYAAAWETYGLQVYADMGDDRWHNPFWWPLLLSDKKFFSALRCRWNELHQNVLSTNRVIEVADSLVNLLEEPAKRNFQRWPVLGKWVWPNHFVGDDYQSEVTWLKNWIYERMHSLNQKFPLKCGDTEPNVPLEFVVNVYPNPFRHNFTVDVQTENNLLLNVQLFSLNGTEVFSNIIHVDEGINTLEITPDAVPRGVYIYRVIRGETRVAAGKLVKL